MKLKDFYNMHKEKIILTSSALGIGILSFLITLLVYNVDSNNAKNNIHAESNDNIIYTQSLSETQKAVTENLIKKLDELKEKKEKNRGIIKTQEVNKNENEKKNNNSEVISTNIIKENVVETIAKNKEISFIVPVEGNIGMDFSDGKLTYSKTLNEWLSHNGIDYIAEVGKDVMASADGIISDIYKDNKYGYTVTIKHDNNYVSKYSGIQENNNLSIGQNVKQGEVIAKIANGFGFEKEEGSHLHFEVIKDDKNIKPDFI